MTDPKLTLAAQAVLDAATLASWKDYDPAPSIIAAAALRAAVEQTIPVTKSFWGSTLVPILTATESRERIYAIADELEALPND